MNRLLEYPPILAVVGFISRLHSNWQSRRDEMNKATEEEIKAVINSDKVVIFSKSYCPYCKMAKEVFQRLRQSYTAIELEKREDCGSYQDLLGEMTGARSVPRVFINGVFVGGGSEVKELYEQGKLQELLK